MPSGLAVGVVINEISISLTGCGTFLLDLKKLSQIGSFVTPKGFQQGAKKQTRKIENF